MATFLLKWNPDVFQKDGIDDYFEKYQHGENLRWSCGNRKKGVIKGDKFYLLQTGEHGGIIGSGVILSEPYQDKKTYDKTAQDEDANFVNINFDYFFAPNTAIPIQKSELVSSPLKSTIWNSQGSGILFQDEVLLNELNKLWLSRVEIKDFSTADEINDSDLSTLSEGGIKNINVNAYERNAEARRKCLEKWGYACTVCNFHFELRYGSIGRKYIHVHHLQPLSSVKTSHDVDPIKDLRPVCPNCHAMLHSKNPPLSIEELKDIFNLYNKTT
jgi:5-methylcytosine-specific restriction protein A